MNKKIQKGTSFLAFVAGLISTLFVQTPFGFVSMLDGTSYFLAIPLFCAQNSMYNKWFKRLLCLGLLWFLNGAISDFWRGVPLMVAFKAEMIILNAMTIAIVGFWLLKKSPRALVWFVVGNAISQVISLYHFQNGAYLSFAVNNGFHGGGDMSSFLIEKQIYPLWVNMYLMAGVFTARVLFRMPWFVCITAFFVGGVYLLINGGSRSTFLVMVSSSFAMMAYVYFRKTYVFLFRKKIVALIGISIFSVVFKVAYYEMAEAGYLGDAGYEKLDEKKAGKSKALDNRPDIIVNWPFLWRSPIIGAGCTMQDRWGYIEKSGYGGYIGDDGRYREGITEFLGHSCIVGSWTANGIFGLIFWLYVFWLMLDFLGVKVYVLGDAGPFVVYAIIGLMWNVAFSPYGIFRGLVMFTATFLCLVKERRFVDWLASAGLTKQERIDYFGMPG